MSLRRAHPVICLVVLSAYLLNFALVASGAVFCRDSQGQPQFEIACDHGHCDTVPEINHDYNANESCWCSTCHCEDDPLGVAVLAVMTRDIDHGQLTSNAHYVQWYEEPVTLPNAYISCAVLPRTPPGVIQQLRQLRTIVLIV